jgi:hypothetical protein
MIILIAFILINIIVGGAIVILMVKYSADMKTLRAKVTDTDLISGAKVESLAKNSHEKDNVLLENQTYLNTEVAKVRKTLTDLALKTDADENELRILKNNILAIPKVRQDDLPYLSVKEEVIMYTDHFTFDKEHQLVFNKARTITEGFVGNLEHDTKAGSCKASIDKICKNDGSLCDVSGVYWINMAPDTRDMHAGSPPQDFCGSCLTQDKKFAKRCRLYTPDLDVRKRFYDIYYDFKNILDSVTTNMYMKLFSQQTLDAFIRLKPVLIDGMPAKLLVEDTSQQLNIGDDLRNLMALAYHMKLDGKSIPHLSLRKITPNS